MRDAEKRTGKAVARDACNTQAGLESGFYGRASHEHWRQPRPLFQHRKVSAQVKPFLGEDMNAEERRKEAKRRYYERNKQLVIERAKAWKAANKEKVAAGAKVYRDSHKEEMKALQDAWTAKFPEKRRETARRYYARNPEKCRANSRRYYSECKEKATESRNKYRARPEYRAIDQNNQIRRRARIASSAGALSLGIVEKLIIAQKGKCACCGAKLGDDYHLDHIIPLALGGAHEDSNIQLLHSRCNLQKHAKHPIDFMQQMGFLL